MCHQDPQWEFWRRSGLYLKLFDLECDFSYLPTDLRPDMNSGSQFLQHGKGKLARRTLRRHVSPQCPLPIVLSLPSKPSSA